MVKEVYFKPHPNSTVPTLDSVLQQAADRHAAGATNNIPSEILVYYQPCKIVILSPMFLFLFPSR